MQNPDARRRAIVAALIAIGVIAVLAIAIRSRGGDGTPPAPTAVAQGDTSQQPTTDPNAAPTSSVELGSLILGAYKCPETSTPDSDCKNAGAVELTAFSMTLPDGQVVSLDNADRMEDGSYQWLNIPIGSYTLLAASFSGPAGLQVRNIAGPAEPTADGWTIKNADPNQPVVIDIMFAPSGGSPAAG